MDSLFDSPQNTPPRHSSIPTISTTSFADPDTSPRQINRGFTLPTPGSPKRGYKKPAKPREFAKSAKKRQSVLALGSITHLQHFYAKRGIIFKPKKPKN
ncbi:9973_t:CDS:1, partial [Racocetra persica]